MPPSPLLTAKTRFNCYNGVKARLVPQPDGSLALQGQTPASAMSYAVSLPGIFSDTPPDYLKVHVQVASGQVGVCLVDEYARNVFGDPRYCPANDRAYEILFDCKSLDGKAQLMLRSGNINEPSQFSLVAIEPVYTKNDPSLASQMQAQIKTSLARCFRHWYYDTDLGNGVIIPATRQTYMSSFKAARARQMALIDKHFGDIRGWKVLDVACSSGYHSLTLAERGAHVTGIDVDIEAIRQAVFVRDCRGQKDQIDFLCDDILAFNASDEAFDLIYCSGLYYHL
ncbi:MAG TPA: class I SAM-dependent methyltransferase, partial [Alphaproteobacteria bacterium]|nr:class I SAM-dependent methyltransferase [Alphaproteobacteria bacterium]